MADATSEAAARAAALQVEVTRLAAALEVAERRAKEAADLGAASGAELEAVSQRLEASVQRTARLEAECSDERVRLQQTHVELQAVRDELHTAREDLRRSRADVETCRGAAGGGGKLAWDEVDRLRTSLVAMERVVLQLQRALEALSKASRVERASLVDTALGSLRQLSAHLTQALAGLRGTATQDGAGGASGGLDIRSLSLPQIDGGRARHKRWGNPLPVGRPSALPPVVERLPPPPPHGGGVSTTVSGDSHPTEYETSDARASHRIRIAAEQQGAAAVKIPPPSPPTTSRLYDSPRTSPRTSPRIRRHRATPPPHPSSTDSPPPARPPPPPQPPPPDADVPTGDAGATTLPHATLLDAATALRVNEVTQATVNSAAKRVVDRWQWHEQRTTGPPRLVTQHNGAPQPARPLVEPPPQQHATQLAPGHHERVRHIRTGAAADTQEEAALAIANAAAARKEAVRQAKDVLRWRVREDHCYAPWQAGCDLFEASVGWSTEPAPPEAVTKDDALLPRVRSDHALLVGSPGWRMEPSAANPNALPRVRSELQVMRQVPNDVTARWRARLA